MAPLRPSRTPLPTSSPFRSSSPCRPVSSTTTTHGPKRPLDVTELECLEEDPPYRKKRRAKHDFNTLHIQWGRVLARIVDAYNPPPLIVSMGLKWELTADKSTFSEEQHTQVKSFDLLTHHITALDIYLGQHAPGEIKTMAEHMRFGQDSARSDDTSALKKHIVEMLQHYDPEAAQGLHASDKSNRGFNHPLTGRLLCPAKLDYGDERLRDSLKSQEYDLSPTDWPLFLYQNYKYNAQDQFQGLFKSEILVQAYKCVFLGPSAWLRMDGKTKTTRSPKAALCEMDKVTTRSIAYVAVLTYFALSSSENYQKQGGSFNLSALYWQIVGVLEDEDLKEEANEVLLWWDKQVFPSKSSTKTPAEKAVNPIAILKAQKAAKRAAALEDTTNHEAV